MYVLIKNYSQRKLGTSIDAITISFLSDIECILMQLKVYLLWYLWRL